MYSTLQFSIHFGDINFYCKGQHHLLANVSKARIKMQEMWLVTSFLLVQFSLWFVLPLNIGGESNLACFHCSLSVHLVLGKLDVKTCLTELGHLEFLN